MGSARYLAMVAVAAAIVFGGVALGRDNGSSTETSLSPSTTTTTTTPTTTTTTAPPTTTTTAPPPPEVPKAVAPLTGLAVPAVDLLRPALVAKIDGSLPALPQEGLETADLVYEVKIEWGSRYLGVWHSRLDDRIGPVRSARTTDIPLLAAFGHPVFAYSGANPGVGEQLAATNWKTDATQGRVPAGYERVENRPWHNALMARPAELWKVRTPGVAPVPVFDYHPAGSEVAGIPIEAFTAYPGLLVDFRWDPAVAGWRRVVWMQEHVMANGSPVAPTNVVVLQMPYQPSLVDERSPEALSVGSGRAWVFTRGTAREGRWIRWNVFDRWNLRDANGNPITLDPGQTWVVMAEEAPGIR